MRAFSISLNHEKLCLAGVGEHGVLSAIVNWVAGDHGSDLFIHVGGLANEEHIDWVKQKSLQVGDEIHVKIVEARSVDKPVGKRRIRPAETLKAKRQYVAGWRKSLAQKSNPGPKNPDRFCIGMAAREARCVMNVDKSPCRSLRLDAIVHPYREGPQRQTAMSDGDSACDPGVSFMNEWLARNIPISAKIRDRHKTSDAAKRGNLQGCAAWCAARGPVRIRFHLREGITISGF